MVVCSRVLSCTVNASACGTHTSMCTHTFHFGKQTSCACWITRSKTLRAALESSRGANAMQSSSPLYLLLLLLTELHSLSLWVETSQI